MGVRAGRGVVARPDCVLVVDVGHSAFGDDHDDVAGHDDQYHRPGFDHDDERRTDVSWC